LTFLVVEIIFYLVIAAALGLVVGVLLGMITWRPKPADVSDDFEVTKAEIERLYADMAARDAQIEVLTSELAPYRTDDLKLIDGVGPVFERTLNSMGFSTFDDVAAWTLDDIRDVAAEIALFPDRIVRDQWVEQAAALIIQKQDPDGGGADQDSPPLVSSDDDSESVERSEPSKESGTD